MKKKWNDLSPQTRKLLSAAAVVQLLLLGLSHADLSRRSADEIRGRKGVWRAVTLVNFVGPLAYFSFGRTPRR